MTGDEWGPWIEHDGAYPDGLVAGMCVNVEFRRDSGTVEPGDRRVTAPHFLWRWKRIRVGLFRTELIRVCDDPDLMPIIRYRIRKPRGMAMLREIAQGIRQPETETASAPGGSRQPSWTGVTEGVSGRDGPAHGPDGAVSPSITSAAPEASRSRAHMRWQA